MYREVEDTEWIDSLKESAQTPATSAVITTSGSSIPYNGNIVNTDVWASNAVITAPSPYAINVDDDAIIKLGDEEFTGAQFNKMFSLMKELLKEKYPEEFI